MNFNATFIGQIFAMAVFVWFCKNYVWPPFMGVMEERKKRIADGLEAAGRLHRGQEKPPQLGGRSAPAFAAPQGQLVT